VNTSRGKIVDEKAMYDALRSGHVAGYATDVFESEPPVGSLLLALPNVVATPHMGTHTLESLKLMGDRVADAVLRVFRGERPEFVVNPEVYDRFPSARTTR
jgi:phosphoglycerate dehydrogenase-like enzyme